MKQKWIWVKNDPIENDSYGEFIGKFCRNGDNKVILHIACDSIYNVEINGKLAAFGACSDYPHRKYYDSVDVTPYCKAENELKINVWYLGVGNSNYKTGERGLAFEITQGNNVLLTSDENILSRKNINFKNGYCKSITSQLGLSFLYDNTVENTLPFENSVVNGEITAEPRGRKNCVVQGRVPVTISRIENGYRVAWERETVGFLELDFVSPQAQKLTIAYGEHLGFGKVLRLNGGQDFSVEFIAKAGKNQYRNAFRRLAGRYLDIECETELDISYIGLNEVLYPQEKVERQFTDPLSQKIYDTCVHTLVCCMHDHYEDCPWREQSFYVMDSRNQMLCGYFAFDGTEYQASNLKLIGDGLRKDGLLDICFPSGKPYSIPFFSLIFPMQLYEYTTYSKDKTLINDLLPIARQILDGFEKRIDETGLIPALKGHWNFYEWTDGSYADQEYGGSISPTHYDLILNCAYVYACDYYEKLTGERRDTSALKSAIERNFYNEEKGLFKLCLSGKERYSQLGNAFAYLIGLGKKPGFAERLLSDELIEASLSMRSFYYDALLQADENYKEYVLKDIKIRYKKMLDEGATTFWETELGWRDTIGFAGSLCHGWSALPIYYLCKYEQ